MGKLGDMFINWIKRKYEKKNIPWERSDSITWGFWGYVFPILIFIPILFWLLKRLMIDYLLKQKGFETTIIYISIIIIIKPLIIELLTRIINLKK